MIRGVVTPSKSRVHPIALIEDEESIQASLMEVINALVRNTLDVPRAQLILRALHIAMRNSRHVHFDLFEERMVREVPAYPQAPPAPNRLAAALAQAEALMEINQPRAERDLEDRRSERHRFDVALAAILKQWPKELTAR